MAIACKCDRCGRLYEYETIESLMHQRDNNKPWYSVTMEMCPDIRSRKVDLCPVCMMLLINWIENIPGGTIRE